MKEQLFSMYKTIGEIHSNIEKADTLEAALSSSLRLITAKCDVEYAAAWFFGETDGLLRPFYWLAPLDLLACAHRSGEGDVGSCFLLQKAIRRLDYRAGDDPATDLDYAGIDICSALCVPLTNGEEDLGVLQLLSSGKIGEETADICEILSMMIAMELLENTKFFNTVETTETVMKVRNVTRSYSNGSGIVTQVLKGVNLDVYEGEFLVLLGESGCGKSTLLNILGGMDEATEGSVEFLGTDITHEDDEALTMFRRKNIGFIFQSYNLMGNLTAKQNLDLIGELVDDPMDSVAALDMVGLKEKAGSYPSQLSGGQQQRVSIARALVKKPKLIFADEPTAALDYTTSIEVLSVLEHIVRESKTTMVMVTHNEEITRMADRVVRLRNGRVYEITVNRHPVHAEELVW